jgi:hypothetical protein
LRARADDPQADKALIRHHRRTSPMYLPVRVLPASTKGWRNISITMGGGGMLAETMVYRFTRQRY